MIFLKNDTICFYPADEESKTKAAVNQTAVQRALKNNKKYFIERNVTDIMGSKERLTNFWAPLGEVGGALGLQFALTEGDLLLPTKTLEEPYPMHHLAIFDKNEKQFFTGTWGNEFTNK